MMFTLTLLSLITFLLSSIELKKILKSVLLPKDTLNLKEKLIMKNFSLKFKDKLLIFKVTLMTSLKFAVPSKTESTTNKLLSMLLLNLMLIITKELLTVKLNVLLIKPSLKTSTTTSPPNSQLLPRLCIN